ncbi:hypothetical protein V6N12_000927 [Hibiscus sabdariffa]|uniref:Uncharacterized protein n=1 Tax=Hibiscus sabdariffa TaxID=183260 RepID=A0ABR2AJ39_9ROSI
MKASSVILCFLLASSLFIPTSTMARQLLQYDSPPPSPPSPYLTEPDPVRICGRGQPYKSCIPNNSPLKPHPNCSGIYNRERGCRGYPSKP